MMDECLWGDVCGYVWGRTNEKIQVPVKNEKERQTYYGAVDYYTNFICNQKTQEIVVIQFHF